MSHVDNVVFSFSILEDEKARMREVNAWLRERANGQEFGPDLGDLDTAYGGRKFLETPLYLAAFNYLPEDDFLAFLRTVPWEFPGEVQFIVKRQHDDLFEVVHPFAVTPA